ncbi:hypothetical protein niasHT_025806 [Heterodera trifolii]|uniref:BTB domain-containing protein n=1 Tax=Heterodera trifolii TaxID=157864 RepID=A0ABD2KTU3_9BILA
MNRFLGKPPTKPVEIKNIKFDVFKAILLYLYCGEMTEVNGENLFEVFIAADQYFMSELVAECLQFDFSEIPNIFTVYSESLNLKGPNFEHFAQNCLRFIDANAKSLLFSDEFLHIDNQLLCKILERNELTICDEFDTEQLATPVLKKKLNDGYFCNFGQIPNCYSTFFKKAIDPIRIPRWLRFPPVKMLADQQKMVQDQSQQIAQLIAIRQNAPNAAAQPNQGANSVPLLPDISPFEPTDDKDEG